MPNINEEVVQQAREIGQQANRFQLNAVAQLKKEFNIFVLEVLKNNQVSIDDTEAAHEVAKQLLEKPENRERADQFAIEAVKLGRRYVETGEKVKTNINPLGSREAAEKLGVEAFKFAAEQGNKEGLQCLINCYRKGTGMSNKPNMQIAMKLEAMLGYSPEQLRATDLPSYNPLLIHANQGRGRAH